MSWSTQQLQAIESMEQNLLVAAGAGSGKTSVLVERIIRRITCEKNPVGIDRILVVTFTNAAASEMRERIGIALSEALKKTPQSGYIERQMLLLNTAAISTFHAFCQFVVRQNFHLLDLDPGFRIGGQAEIELLKNDVLEQVFEDYYSLGDPDFLQLVEHYGDESSDVSLQRLVLTLYDFSRSHPWPDYWLGWLKCRFELPADMDIEDTPWAGLIRESVILKLKQARRMLQALRFEASKPGNPEAYAQTFAADITVLDDLIAAAGDSWHRLDTVMGMFKFETIAKVGKEVSDEVKKGFQNQRDKVKRRVNTLKNTFFARPAEQMLEDMRSVAPLVDTLASLVIAFGERFNKAKRAKCLVDFNDLEHYCLQILLEPGVQPGELKPSAVAQALQEKFVEVMVDEYQDTNEVQEAILRLVSRTDRPNLFMVGDVKQSIYRFRLAEPELFMEKYRRYPTDGAGMERRVDLAQNFRSRPGIIQAVNFLFAQLMTPQVAGLEYGEAERLEPGPDYPQAAQPVLDGPIELCLIEGAGSDRTNFGEDTEESGDGEEAATEGENPEELRGFELEARLIARRILEFMEAGYCVYDKQAKQYRGLAWRDIVVLLRSVQGKAAIVLETLRQAGIPVYAEIDSGYFQETEVHIVLSLLNIIDNPRQDIHLAGVLRSPLVGLTASQLAEIRLCKPDADLWEAVAVFAQSEAEPLLQEKVSQFIAQLEKWRSFSRRKGVPELIWQIYRDTGYYDYVGGMPGGMLRQANLRAMYDRARQYEETDFRGLFRFLRFIERLKDKGSDLSVARALGESEDVVRVMSIHKSKGLEFPVVFVADLGKGINLQDSKALVLCHKLFGVGPFVTNPELRFRYPTLARYGIQYKLDMETKAEELRILYVALTRAREKLILVGSASNLKDKCAEWCRQVGRKSNALPDSLLAGAKTYFDWLCPAAARHSSAKALRQYARCGDEPEGDIANDQAEWDVRIYQRDELASVTEAVESGNPLLERVRCLKPVNYGEGTAQVADILGWQYPYRHMVGKPAKLSVSEIKRRFEQPESDAGQRVFESRAIAARPRFLQAEGKMTAAEFGVLMHTVMQHLNLAGDLSEDGVRRQVREFVDREILLAEQAGEADIAAIVAFFASELGQRMCASPRIRRELPFSLMLPAGRFYQEMDDTQEGIFVQGVIDCLFDEPGGLVLVDYKTDRIKDSAEIAGKYTTQLNIYAEAVETIFKQPVKEKYLYMFSSGEIVKV